jgi:phosphatidylglycerophosphatase A
MKKAVEKRKPEGIVDYIALALTTFGVGYIPGAPGTYGSIIGVCIYVGMIWLISVASILVFGGDGKITPVFWAVVNAIVAIGLVVFSLAGIWASGRAVSMLGNDDPHEAVVDEVIGQIITLIFVPYILHWTLILPGFLLFRLFDIWKPYPIDSLQALPGGLGICADDIVAGVYAGICLAVGHAIYMSL